MLKLLMKMIVNINKWKDFIGKNIVYYIINYSIFNAKILKYKILRNSRIDSILLEKKKIKTKKYFDYVLKMVYLFVYIILNPQIIKQYYSNTYNYNIRDLFIRIRENKVNKIFDLFTLKLITLFIYIIQLIEIDLIMLKVSKMQCWNTKYLCKYFFDILDLFSYSSNNFFQFIHYYIYIY